MGKQGELGKCMVLLLFSMEDMKRFFSLERGRKMSYQEGNYNHFIDLLAEMIVKYHTKLNVSEQVELVEKLNKCNEEET